MDDYKEIAKNEQKLDNIAKYCFDKLDKDRNGYIEKNELGNLLNEIALIENKSCPCEDDIDKWMKSLDIDNSGKIEYKEFKNFIRSTFYSMCN